MAPSLRICAIASPLRKAGFAAPRIARLSTSRILSEDIKVFRDVPALRAYRRQLQQEKRSVGLVPTMGALHEGHLSLARNAAAENSEVFVSIYVNPAQFGVNEDLDKYPRTWDADMAKLEEFNNSLASSGTTGRVTAVFAPTTKTMYPTLPPTSEIDGQGSFVTITPLGSILEGASRPVFFRGVATVCTKLFNIVQPERVYFGQKDVQQCAVIRRLVTDLHLDTRVRIIPTERESDGLAMSSRNVNLGRRRRAAAACFPLSLRAAEKQYKEQGSLHRDDILRPFREILDVSRIFYEQLEPMEKVVFDLDYVSLADPDTMEEVPQVDPAKGAILSAALKMQPLEFVSGAEDCPGRGTIPVRLIDNLILPPR
ncbi:hypothetical protein FH972_022437 [Carpinus fangiana]|uniref:Pantoate--beta-alanine ligase n=1 Tax=Carpinus fangiana TaxID=176857 RepID=A0A5N6KSM1_9ROSI|nr:hypothetical protein FH972_022437 [Carpinus fangiana]